MPKKSIVYIIFSLILSFLATVILFGFSIFNHWVDYDTGSSDPAVTAGATRLINAKHDYGFPLQIHDAPRKFGTLVYPEPDYPRILWFNLVINFVVYAVAIFFVLTLTLHFTKQRPTNHISDPKSSHNN